MKFVHKNDIIDAVQYVGNNATAIVQWVGVEHYEQYINGTIKVHNLKIEINDWVIKKSTGMFLVIKAQLFDESYLVINNNQR